MPGQHSIADPGGVTTGEQAWRVGPRESSTCHLFTLRGYGYRRDTPSSLVPYHLLQVGKLAPGSSKQECWPNFCPVVGFRRERKP